MGQHFGILRRDMVWRRYRTSRFDGMVTMLGMFFHRDLGDYYQTGEIIRKVSPEAYLTRVDFINGDNPCPINPLIMFAVMDFSDVDDEGLPIFRFFDTRSDLQAWLAWMDKPDDEPKKVVRLVKKEKVH